MKRENTLIKRYTEELDKLTKIPGWQFLKIKYQCGILKGMGICLNRTRQTKTWRRWKK